MQECESPVCSPATIIVCSCWIAANNSKLIPDCRLKLLILILLGLVQKLANRCENSWGRTDRRHTLIDPWSDVIIHVVRAYNWTFWNFSLMIYALKKYTCLRDRGNRVVGKTWEAFIFNFNKMMNNYLVQVLNCSDSFRFLIIWAM